MAAYPAKAADVIAIGDSLTAEYDTIPEVPGFPNEATAYAEVTVPGWESMSWVEVLSRLQRSNFNFGGYKKLPDLWSVPRMSGYELNWGIPGVFAGQYEDFVTSSPWENLALFVLRQPLEEQLRERAQRVVIWLGTNDFRASYGALYDGESSESLIDGVIDDVEKVIDFVRGRNSRLQIVLANIPDLGATPAKKAAHPDATKRARVTTATVEANARLADLAKKKGVPIADVYSASARLVQGLPTYFGAVEILNDKDADNDPHYQFTRDGLHPNTASQIENARAIIRAFNSGYGAGLPQITNAQALKLLGIAPNEPYFQWLESYDAAERAFTADSDRDGLSQLAEYAFGLDPTRADADEIPVTIGGAVGNFPGTISVRYTLDSRRARHVLVRVQYSSDQVLWKNVPAARVLANGDGSFTAAVPPSAGPVSLRLRLFLRTPDGALTAVTSVVSFE